MNKRIITSLTLTVLFASFATADVRLPAIISDNMVIQADTKAPIWGWAEPNETITVIIGKQKQSVIVDTNGKWMIKLKPMKASDTPVEMTITGKNVITIKNILVGQVWLGSGQSNMAFMVSGVVDANNEIRNGDYPSIRLFTVPCTVTLQLAADCKGQWVECSPQTVGGFSAVAYFFGRELHKEIKQPVGLISSSWGGTIAETWMSQESLRANPDFAHIIQQYEEMLKAYPNGQADYDKAPQHPSVASLLYNSMIAPLVPYSIKGVIWYQGEANAGHAKEYQTLFPALIADWRNQWQEGNFPFLFVQIADFKMPLVWGDPIVWAELRDAQLKTLSVPNTGMVVTTDIGDVNDIHPKNKQEVGRRLALWALAKNYGKKIEYSGPLYEGMNIKSGKIHLTFTHVDGGLVAKGGELKGFTIAGIDQKFVPATANIKNGKVIVENPDVKEPVAVRYGWADVTTECNLYNAAGLPASPFRTDNWPGVTDNLK